jgi:hypothetical protein
MRAAKFYTQYFLYSFINMVFFLAISPGKKAARPANATWSADRIVTVFLPSQFVKDPYDPD